MKKEKYLQLDEVKSFVKFLSDSKNKDSERLRENEGKGDAGCSDSAFKEKFFRHLEKCEKKYEWPFTCSVFDGDNIKVHKGRSLIESTKALNSLSNLLKESTEREQKYNGVSTVLGCLGVLQWGGVLNGNAKTILNRSDEIGQKLRKVSEALLKNCIDDCEAAEVICEELTMNSGFTKIYSMLIDDFVMYDGRVGAALGRLVRCFCEQEKYEKVPGCLRFPWGEASGKDKLKRNPSKSPYVFPKLTNSEAGAFCHAIWNIRANWIIGQIVDEMKLTTLCINGTKVPAPRQLEAALFMTGGDVCGEEDAAEKCEIKQNATRLSGRDRAKKIKETNPDIRKQDFVIMVMQDCKIKESTANSYWYSL